MEQTKTVDWLGQIICKNPEIMLDSFGLTTNRSGDRLYMACPLHGGENPNALSLYLDRDRYACYSRECHKSTFNSLIGFVRLMLSVQHCGWTSPGGTLYSFAGTLKYIKGLYGIDGEVIRSQPGEYVQKARRTPPKPRILGDRNKYLAYNTGRPDFFIKRGFSETVLNKYDVRYCNLRGNANHRRCCVPQYDEANRNVIGISGRTTCNEEPKWKYSYKFPCGYTLYNLNYASEYIRRMRSVVITEGPCDVWRLEEAGVHNTVAIWSALGWNDCKKMLLDKLGIVKIILALDNDDAGKAGREKVRRAVGSFYNIVDVRLPEGIKDIADLPVSEVKELFKCI